MDALKLIKMKSDNMCILNVIIFEEELGLKGYEISSEKMKFLVNALGGGVNIASKILVPPFDNILLKYIENDYSVARTAEAEMIDPKYIKLYIRKIMIHLELLFVHSVGPNEDYRRIFKVDDLVYNQTALLTDLIKKNEVIDEYNFDIVAVRNYTKDLIAKNMSNKDIIKKLRKSHIAKCKDYQNRMAEYFNDYDTKIAIKVNTLTKQKKKLDSSYDKWLAKLDKEVVKHFKNLNLKKRDALFEEPGTLWYNQKMVEFLNDVYGDSNKIKVI